MDITGLLKELEARSGEPIPKWQEVLEAGRAHYGRARITEEWLPRMLRACDHPGEFADLAGFLGQTNRRHPGEAGPLEDLRERAKPFPYPLEDWLGSMVEVLDFLRERGRKAEFPEIMGYVECAASYGAARNLPGSLRDHVADFLEQAGFAESA